MADVQGDVVLNNGAAAIPAVASTTADEVAPRHLRARRLPAGGLQFPEICWLHIPSVCQQDNIGVLEGKSLRC